MTFRWSVAAIVIAACQFDRPADVGPPIDAAIDAPVPECEAGSRSCVDSLYTECGTDGRYVRYDVPNVSENGTASMLVMNEYLCALGCHPSEPRCLEVGPTNGLEAALDSDEAGPSGMDVVLDDTSGPGSMIGLLDNDSLIITESDGTVSRIPAQMIAQADALPILVLKVRSFTLRSGGRLRVISDRPIAIASRFDVLIGGTLDFSGPTRPFSTTRVGCDVASTVPAAGGGGHDTDGGAASTGSAGGRGLAETPTLTPLEGGCSSGAATGGGGLQIVSRTRIRLESSAIIDVSGRGGQVAAGAASGGGAGGSVLLEAPNLGLAVGSVINGRGGSGAAANLTTGVHAAGRPGNDDITSSTVEGATCVGCGRGGNGATEVAGPGGGTGVSPSVAGGGGALGRCVTRTADITLAPPGTMKIRRTQTSIVVR